MRPEVRIIDEQTEEIKNPDISGYERDFLLHKYGFSSNEPKPNSGGLTFEEMCKLEEEKTRPKKNLDNINYVEDPDTGYKFKITINRY
jgi:hypothetical protein